MHSSLTIIFFKIIFIVAKKRSKDGPERTNDNIVPDLFRIESVSNVFEEISDLPKFS